MNYEEKYKEALERARAIYQGKYKPETAATIAETLQSIFPELVESEDERIRKELLDYLHTRQVIESLTDTKVKMDWITWLEKQGGQIHTDKVELRLKVEDNKQVLQSPEEYSPF